MIYDKIAAGLSKGCATIGSLVKVALLSRKVSAPAGKPQRDLIILGNGPSLPGCIENNRDLVETSDRMAVNFAANTPEFLQLQPELYILADGHFFNGYSTDPNVRKLWENISSASWDMTLFVPYKFHHQATQLLAKHGNDNSGVRIKVRTFNLTPLEGYPGVIYPLMRLGMGMPRPRNVMIPAIMTAIREGYRKIYLFGADHTWTRTLSVDEENFVVSVQPHYYEDNDKEHQRVRSTYAGLHLHDVLGSMTVAFRSYWEIAAYADSLGVSIINATPGSMIDAFPRI